MNATAKILASLFFIAGLAGCVETLGGLAPNQSQAETPPTNDDIRFSQTDRGAMITSSDKVLFETARSEVRPEGANFIASLVNTAKKSNARVLIEGHTDNVGGAAYNQALSESRADSVKKALMQGGIASEKITTVGLGQTQPIASNDNEAGRARNRRTEVILLGERLENINRDDFFSNMGRAITAFVGSISERLQSKPTTDSFDPNNRVRILGPVTHCGNRQGSQYLILDGSSVEPRVLTRGQQAILTVNVQLCVKEGDTKTLSQSIKLLKNGVAVAAGGDHKFPNVQRLRFSLYSRITAGEAMAPGNYTVESTVNLDGRSYRQTTPFTVQ